MYINVFQVLQRNNFDLLFAMGRNYAIVAKEVTLKENKLIPIVFGSVMDPVGNGLVRSEESSGNHLTGTSSRGHDYLKQVELLLSLGKKIRKVVIFYRTGSYLYEKRMFDLGKEFLIQNGIRVEEIAIEREIDMFVRLQPHLSTTDVILLLRDYLIMSQIENLVALCNLCKITLYTSDLESVKKGAALGFGGSERTLGVEAAYKVLPILEQNRHPSSIPITPVTWDCKLMINTRTMIQQGLDLDITKVVSTLGDSVEVI